MAPSGAGVFHQASVKYSSSFCSVIARRLFGRSAGRVRVHLPISTRLHLGEPQDRLSLAYNTFFADLFVPPPSENELTLRFRITQRGEAADSARLTLQLVLKTGEALETGAGEKITLGADRIELGPAELGGRIRHHGWTMKLDPSARLVWPVYPFNPYADGAETNPEWAVGALSVDLHPTSSGDGPGHHKEQQIDFVILVE